MFTRVLRKTGMLKVPELAIEIFHYPFRTRQQINIFSLKFVAFF